jgi:hypothetical protein
VSPEIRDSEGNVRVGETVAGPFHLPLAGARVDQCALDHALTLVLDRSGLVWTVRIEGTFHLTARGGSTQRFESGDDAPPSSWGPAVDALLHDDIAAASVKRDGTLELLFVGGWRVEVPPTDQWEAWQINGPAGELIVCEPGGQLSRWPAEPRTGR